MSIYQRGKSKTWQISFKTKSGERVRISAGTENKQQAQELHDKLKAQGWREDRLGAKPRYTWQQAVVRWLTEQSHKKSIETDKIRFRWLDQHLNDSLIDEINKTLIDKIKAAKKNGGASNGTVNRNLALIRSVLNMAKNEWEWLDSVPNIKLFPEPMIRIRWLSHGEADRLLSELPEHLKAMAKFSLATGLRESNVTGLQWSQLDMQRRCAWIHADQAKGKRSIAVPLNDDALFAIRGQIGKHETHVFTYKGNPVSRANNHAWNKAIKRAGLDGFKWHGLRHTWASWHIMNGTPLNVLKELGGWSDLTMVMRYAHLSSEHLNGYADNLSNLDLVHTLDTRTKKA